MLDWAQGIWLSIGWPQLWGLAILCALVLAFAGHLLPPVRSVRRQTCFPVSPAHLFPLIADAKGQLSWRRDLAAVEETADGGWTETLASGEVIRFRVLESQPFRRLSLRFSSGRGFQGRWRLELVPQDDGALRLELEEEIELFHPFKRLLARLTFDRGAVLDQYLDDLRAALTGKRWQ